MGASASMVISGKEKARVQLVCQLFADFWIAFRFLSVAGSAFKKYRWLPFSVPGPSDPEDGPGLPYPRADAAVSGHPGRGLGMISGSTNFSELARLPAPEGV